jgi:hypothetical protein
VFGWDWSWVGTGVVAYPSIFFGDSPFDDGRTSDKLPVLLGSKAITARFQVTTEATGKWDTAFDMFVASTPNARRGTMTHEIMIWTDASQMVPAGDRVGELVVGGVTWDLYYKPDMVLSDYGYTNHFGYTAYLAREPVQAGPLDIGAFFADLLDRGYLPADGYLACISFGNEVSLGQGHTEVSGFAIDVADLP